MAQTIIDKIEVGMRIFSLVDNSYRRVIKKGDDWFEIYGTRGKGAKPRHFNAYGALIEGYTEPLVFPSEEEHNWDNAQPFDIGECLYAYNEKMEDGSIGWLEDYHDKQFYVLTSLDENGNKVSHPFNHALRYSLKKQSIIKEDGKD
jgi:hypothetical protein